MSIDHAPQRSDARARREPISFADDRLNRKEAAAYLGISPGTLEVWASTGRYAVPYVRVGRRAFYRRSELDLFLERRTVQAAP